MTNKEIKLEQINSNNSICDDFPLANEFEVSSEDAKIQFFLGNLGSTEVGENQI